jgi:hypothetical protein
LSKNPNAILLLEADPDKIDWCNLSENPNAIHLFEGIIVVGVVLLTICCCVWFGNNAQPSVEIWNEVLTEHSFSTDDCNNSFDNDSHSDYSL